MEAAEPKDGATRRWGYARTIGTYYQVLAIGQMLLLLGAILRMTLADREPVDFFAVDLTWILLLALAPHLKEGNAVARKVFIAFSAITTVLIGLFLAGLFLPGCEVQMFGEFQTSPRPVHFLVALGGFVFGALPGWLLLTQGARDEFRRLAETEADVGERG